MAARADKISHPIAIFDGLDKITGRIISFEVGINETVQFGALQITPRVCYSRPLTEAPQTDAFAQVDEIDEEKKLKRIFSGWMFADSPGLHGIEHPIFDIWLTGCKGGTVVIHDAPAAEASAPNPDESPPTDTGVDRNRDHGAAGARAAEEEESPSLSRLSFAAPDAVTVAPLDPPPAQPTPGNARAAVNCGGRIPSARPDVAASADPAIALERTRRGGCPIAAPAHSGGNAMTEIQRLHQADPAAGRARRSFRRPISFLRPRPCGRQDISTASSDWRSRKTAI